MEAASDTQSHRLRSSDPCATGKAACAKARAPGFAHSPTWSRPTSPLPGARRDVCAIKHSRCTEAGAVSTRRAWSPPPHAPPHLLPPARQAEPPRRPPLTFLDRARAVQRAVVDPKVGVKRVEQNRVPLAWRDFERYAVAAERRGRGVATGAARETVGQQQHTALRRSVARAQGCLHLDRPPPCPTAQA